MRRVKFAAFIVLMMIGTTGSLPDRALALPLSDPGVHILAMTGNPVQRARYVCHRWWQWHGARWVRSCWPSGNDPGRAKTFFLPEKLHATGGGPRRHDRLSMFSVVNLGATSPR